MRKGDTKFLPYDKTQESSPDQDDGKDDSLSSLPDFGGKYEAVCKLGEGAMGIIVKARQRDLDRFVAIKILQKQVLEGSDTILNRFNREAKAAAALNHPNIVTVHDVSRTGDGTPFIVLEFIDGEDMSALLKRERRLSLERVLELLPGVADALDKAHRAGVVHRDLKPANLFLTSYGSLKVLDFGICHIVAEKGKLTGTADIIGTPLYMAPEQFLGDEPNGATDQYALALIVYEMLSGRLPFNDIYSRVTRKAEPVSGKIENIPSGVSRAIDRALSINPEDRFSTVSEFVEEMACNVSGNSEKQSYPVLSSGKKKKQSMQPRLKKQIAIGMSAVLAVIIALGLLTTVRDKGLGNLPPEPSIAVLPFKVNAERNYEKILWPLFDRTVINSLEKADVVKGTLRRIDPLRVLGEMKRREMDGIRSMIEAREIGHAVNADLVLSGSVDRKQGFVEAQADLIRVSGDNDIKLNVKGIDLFKTATLLAGKVVNIIGNKGADIKQGKLDPGFAEAWYLILTDPWSLNNYKKLSLKAKDSPDARLQKFASALLNKTDECEKISGILEKEYPQKIGSLAKAACLFRKGSHARALTEAEKAFESLPLREEAARFIGHIQVSSRSIEEQISFHEQRCQLFPHDVDLWWHMSNLYLRAGRNRDAADAMQVAESLTDERKINFKAALNGVRTSIQELDLSGASVWMQRLERAKPGSEWDIEWRFAQKSALLQMQGRFGDSQKVLEEARKELAPVHGDPYTIMANALFYSYLHFGNRNSAEKVAEEYISFFQNTTKPDRWTALLMDLALKYINGKVKINSFTAEAERIGQKLLESVGDTGKKERDGFLCLLFSYLGPYEKAQEIHFRADPKNTMVGGCRFRAAQIALGENRYSEARLLFERARKEILFRSDWYLEFVLQSLIGEARAAEGAGELEDARRLYLQITRNYEYADRELDDIKEAHRALSRIRSSPDG